MNIRNASGFKDLLKIYRLYKKAFPHYERKPFIVILNARRRRCSDVLIIENEGNFSGLAITLNTEKITLLDYFAVSEEKRGTGIGGQALQLLRERYKNKKFLLEIESTFTEAENHTDRLRRKRFYLNNGMTEAGLTVNLFGTDMEILTDNCNLSFKEYADIYHKNFGKLAEGKITELKYPDK